MSLPGVPSLAVGFPVHHDSAGIGRTVRLHPREGLLQEARALQRSPRYSQEGPFAGGGQAPIGAAHPPGGSQGRIHRLSQDQVPSKSGRHRGQPDPVGQLHRHARRFRPRTSGVHQPSRCSPRLQRHPAHKPVADSCLPRHSLIDQNNPVEMGFPSEFLELRCQRICHSFAIPLIAAQCRSMMRNILLRLTRNINLQLNET